MIQPLVALALARPCACRAPCRARSARGLQFAGHARAQSAQRRSPGPLPSNADRRAGKETPCEPAHASSSSRRSRSPAVACCPMRNRVIPGPSRHIAPRRALHDAAHDPQPARSESARAQPGSGHSRRSSPQPQPAHARTRRPATGPAPRGEIDLHRPAADLQLARRDDREIMPRLRSRTANADASAAARSCTSDQMRRSIRPAANAHALLDG